MTALTESEAAAVLIILVVPWAVIALVAMFRGYAVRIYRDRQTPPPDADDDSPDH